MNRGNYMRMPTSQKIMVSNGQTCDERNFPDLKKSIVKESGEDST